ncbi:sodium:proton symporter (plasmid) [Bacillus albus]|uniref:sodium:proton symporter n=1 Tax=Bacillus cereus group TaxID=86661 RepID=UPI0022DF4658|nr:MULTISPECIES: sodium:proton symporter [Bacillus cereus group]MDA2029558.1 sodium:proton symporter [Bacillus cereus group sp. Bcc03]MDA2219088.1 sodium:proton symporter [Bacillus cereus group sp. Bc228]MDA2230707.1 sodium:proton symporter [Bacillus cereus group sp. Bc227]MDA2263448.1 sodium:proton symporter [Bacillus cereus group sp. Bc200]MDA2716260.1 sodium:proton symporter [Bacillus cereus group sp. Bc025]
MRFIETVHIKWYGLYSINDLYNREEASKKGIFTISRVDAKNITLLYIGKTKRSFIQKIREINKEWLFDDSELKITLGIIEFPSGESYSEKKVKEIKSLLILRHTPLENKTSLLYHRGKVNLKIINKGRRGLIVKKLSTKDLIWT